MNNTSKMQISIVIGLLASGFVTAFIKEPIVIMTVGVGAGFAVGYFYALGQKKSFQHSSGWSTNKFII